MAWKIEIDGREYRLLADSADDAISELWTAWDDGGECKVTLDDVDSTLAVNFKNVGTFTVRKTGAGAASF